MSPLPLLSLTSDINGATCLPILKGGYHGRAGSSLAGGERKQAGFLPLPSRHWLALGTRLTHQQCKFPPPHQHLRLWGEVATTRYDEVGLGVFRSLHLFGDSVLGGEGLGDPRVWWQRPCPWPWCQELQVYHEEVRRDGDLLPQKRGWEPQCHEAVADRGAGIGGGSATKLPLWINQLPMWVKGQGWKRGNVEKLAPVEDSWCTAVALIPQDWVEVEGNCPRAIMRGEFRYQKETSRPCQF